MAKGCNLASELIHTPFYSSGLVEPIAEVRCAFNVNFGVTNISIFPIPAPNQILVLSTPDLSSRVVLNPKSLTFSVKHEAETFNPAISLFNKEGDGMITDSVYVSHSLQKRGKQFDSSLIISLVNARDPLA
jgi:hypothetical protein